MTNGVFLFSEMDVDSGSSFTQAGGIVSAVGEGIGVSVRDGGTYNLIDGAPFGWFIRWKIFQQTAGSLINPGERTMLASF